MRRTTIKLGEPLSTDVREFCDQKGYTFTGLVKRLVKEEMVRDPIGK